jgi:hypothetical protein
MNEVRAAEGVEIDALARLWYDGWQLTTPGGPFELEVWRYEKDLSTTAG